MTACSNNHAVKKVTTVTTPTVQHQSLRANKQNAVRGTVQARRHKQAPVVFPRARQIAVPKRSYRPSRPSYRPKRSHVARRPPATRNSSFSSNLSNAALGRLRSRVRYDGSYVKIAYPWGDVPANTGVCTDVVIRSYRRLGIDLQQQVHNDMSAAFNSYPNVRKWKLTRPDSNIDHRRVYNLKRFFTRRGAALPVTHNPHHYKPGDLVTWMVGKDLPHIGVVVNRRSQADPNRYMIVHNIANGPEIEDILFRFPITGHFRYTPAMMKNIPKANYASASRAKRKVSSKSSSMNYAQLIAAAKRLGSQPSKKIKAFDPITLANLNNREMQALLKR